MGSDVGQIFLTASYYRDDSILYALIIEKELCHMDKHDENTNLVCEKEFPHISTQPKFSDPYVS